MSEFTLHTLETAPPASQKLLRGLREKVGFVPNLAAAMAESPTLLQAFLGLRSAASEGGLDPVSREVIAITVAVGSGCSYCAAAHSTFALGAGAAPALVEAARSGTALPDPRLDALVRLARAVVSRQPNVKHHLQDAFKAGLSPAEVLESLVAMVIPLLASAVAQLVDVPLDVAFEPQSLARRA